MDKKPYVIGLDLGGTNSVFGIVDCNANVQATVSLKTQDYKNVNVYVDTCCEMLLPLIENVGGIDNIAAMGIGAPNANFYTGNIEMAANLPWKGIVPLAKMFSDKLGIPVVMTNDANAAALGEMVYGVAKGMKNFIMITLGTGVGSGIVVNGQLLYGCDGFAGELGHVIVDNSDEARPCGCGRKGCLETYCSATGVARTAREFLLKSDKESVLRNISPESITSKDVAEAALSGDELSKEIFEYTGDILGKACANFTAFSSPEAYVFFGGLVKSGELIMKPVRESYDKNVMPIFRGKAKMLVSQLDGAEAAVLGASALAWNL